MNTSSSMQCPRCHGSPDDEQHLHEDCTKGPKTKLKLQDILNGTEDFDYLRKVNKEINKIFKIKP